MAEFEEPARHTRRDPGVTHRDAGIPPPRSDPNATRRDAAPAADALMRLPGALAERFTVVGELPVQGAESDLLLVRDPAGTEQVVKIYRRGYRADRDVWRQLPRLTSRHVVRVLETGHAGDRDYEVIEYAPAGNLRALMERPTPPGAVLELVAQLADGLGCLHEAGIVHRDLKPENILVTGTDPVSVAIADFGLSKVIEQSVVFASSSRTLAYAAPESLSGQVSPARDWWSLGMIVRELVTGRPPFAGLSETAVVDHLATRPIGNSDIAEPRLRLLCQGLLARDPRRRWAGGEVARWLAGEDPPVAAEPPVRRHVSAGAGLPFGGHEYADPAELAAALVRRWDEAARYFFGRGESGEAWRLLRDWLSGLRHDVAGRVELIDGRLTGPGSADVKLLHLIRWLDPDLKPHYLGRRLTADDLAGLRGPAADPAHPDHRTACLIGRALWEERLLPVLAGFAAGAELAGVDERWRASVAAWNRSAGQIRAELRGSLPAGSARPPDAGAPADEPPVVLLTLLALAARPGPTAQWLATAAQHARRRLPAPVPWFDMLADRVHRDSSDPLGALAVLSVAPDAVLAADSMIRHRQAAERTAAERRRQWDEREGARLAGRGRAVLRAVLWCLPLLLGWTVTSWTVGAVFSGTDDGVGAVGGFQRSSGVPLGALLTLSVLAWSVQTGAEVALARLQGRDYLPYGPWSWMSRLLGAGGRGLSTASQAMSGTAQRAGQRGCGLLLLAGTVPLFLLLLLLAAVTPVASLLWTLVLLMVPVAHLAGAGVRGHRWRQAHRQKEQAALTGERS